MPKFPPSWRTAAVAIWILLCTLVSFAVQGQVMEPVANWFQYLPLMAKVHDPALYPRDDFIPILMEKTPSWFWWTLGKLLPTVNPYPYLLILNLMTRLANALLIYGIARHFARDWRAGLFAVFLLSGQADTVLGRGDINWPYFTHTAFSVPLILSSLYLLLRQRPCAAFAVAGAIWNVHLLNAAYYSLFLLFYVVLRWRAQQPRRWLACTALFLLFILPVLPRILPGLHTEGADELWMAHATAYHEKLLSPFTQPLEAWLRFAGYLALFLLLIRRENNAGVRSIAGAMLGMWGVLYGLGFVFTYWIPLPLFLKLQPCRCTDVFILFFFAWFSRDLLRGLRGQDLTESVLHWGLLALLYFFNLRTYPGPFKETMTAIWLLLVSAKTWREMGPSSAQRLDEGHLFLAVAWGGALYALVLLCVSNRWLATSQPVVAVMLSRRTILLTSLLFFIGAAYLIQRLRSAAPPPGPLPRRVALVLLLGLLAFLWTQRAVESAVTRRAHRGHSFFDRFNPTLYEAAHWCRENTPVDSLFVVPPYSGGFRSESLRSVFASWDEQLAIWIAPPFIREYDHRLHLLGYEPYSGRNPRSSWYPTREQLLKVRAAYGADYLVIETPKLMPLPLLYRNPGYAIYRIE